jgi:serine phosphatase RsbU (regulator of sigma subunit)
MDFERDAISMCAVPLTVADRRLGALRFSFRAPRLFDEQERRFVLALAAQTAQALERAQLHDQRLNLTRRLQRSLLPGRLPDIPGVELAAVHEPLEGGLELGGDFYDVWALPDGRWAFAIGDAAGTGPEASALTAMVRFSLRALMLSDGEPRSVLQKLNREMLEAEASGAEGERFCTLVLGALTPGLDARIELAGGGHPPPLVRRGGSVSEAELGGALLGVLEGAAIGTCEVTLGRGDALVLYTDGVIEARRSGEMFGFEGLEAVVASAEAKARGIADAIEGAVLDYTDGHITDDVAILVVRATD